MKYLMPVAGSFARLLIALIVVSAIVGPASADSTTLNVSMTAEPLETLSYRWSISKAANPRNVVVYPGQSAAVDYTVTVNKELAQTAWTVNGAIAIRNTASSMATLTAVSALVSPNVAAAVRCPVSFPYDLGAGNSLICTYSANVPDASTRTATARVAVVNAAADFVASATVSFANKAVSKVLDSITVNDAYAGSLGATNASRTWTFRRQFSCDPDSGSQLTTATIVQTGQTAQATVGVVCAQAQPASCTRVSVTAGDRAPGVGQTIRVEGHGVSGNGASAVTAYRFVFGDGEQTAWTAPRIWPAVATHAYARAGAYSLQFEMRLANGRIVGGSNTQCAVLIEVNPPVFCGVRAPIVVAGVSQNERRLLLTGRAADYARLTVQIKGPGDAEFLANGTAVADAFGNWAYTTKALARDGLYQIRAAGYGQASENTVSYVVGSGSQLSVAVIRANADGGGVADTYISADDPAASYGEAVTLSLSTDAMNPLLRFDLSAIPADARVAMAKLSLYALDNLPCANMAAAVYQLARSWDPDSVNWTEAMPGMNWSAPSAGGVPQDRLSLAAYTELVQGPQAWYTWDVTEMAQDWVADAGTNGGVIVQAASYGSDVVNAANDLDSADVALTMQPLANGVGGRRDFAASEYPELRRRPVLYVTYVIP